MVIQCITTQVHINNSIICYAKRSMAFLSSTVAFLCRRVKCVPVIASTRNTLHNPVYTSDFVPPTLATVPNNQSQSDHHGNISPAQAAAPNNHPPTGHHGNSSDDGYEYIRITSNNQRAGRDHSGTSTRPNAPANRALMNAFTQHSTTQPRRQTLDTRYVRDGPSTGERADATRRANTEPTRPGAAHGSWAGSGPNTQQSVVNGQSSRNGPANNFGLPAHYETMASCVHNVEH